MRRLLVTITYAAVLGSAAACGVPSDPTPIVISNVPYDLLSPAAAATSRPTTPATRGPFIYLLDGQDRPVPVETDGSDTGELSSDTVAAILARLADGPTEDERRAGLSTALGPTVTLTLRSLEGGLAEIEVDTGEHEPSADRLPLAVGQVVLSVTTVPGVVSVVLTAGDQTINAPLPSGARTDRPLVRDDYEALLQ